MKPAAAIGRAPATAVGETPNLAARAQAKAVPNTVVIADNTRRLVGRAFDLLHLGDFPLKGIGAAVTLYQVAGETSTESRFQTTASGDLTPLIGREIELALLMERWQRAKEGKGQVVLLCGEPGIGKSRLTWALRECVAGELHLVAPAAFDPVQFHCHQGSPYHANTAYYPVTATFARNAGFERQDSVDNKLDKLEALVARIPMRIGEVMPLFAAALSIPTGTRYAPLDISPQQQKERTIDALVSGLVQHAGSSRLCS